MTESIGRFAIGDASLEEKLSLFVLRRMGDDDAEVRSRRVHPLLDLGDAGGVQHDRVRTVRGGRQRSQRRGFTIVRPSRAGRLPGASAARGRPGRSGLRPRPLEGEDRIALRAGVRDRERHRHRLHRAAGGNREDVPADQRRNVPPRPRRIVAVDGQRGRRREVRGRRVLDDPRVNRPGVAADAVLEGRRCAGESALSRLGRLVDRTR